MCGLVVTDRQHLRWRGLNSKRGEMLSRRITLAVVLAPILCSASEGVSLDALVAEALARNPEIKVYSAEIAANVDETEKEKIEKHFAP